MKAKPTKPVAVKYIELSKVCIAKMIFNIT